MIDFNYRCTSTSAFVPDRSEAQAAMAVLRNPSKNLNGKPNDECNILVEDVGHHHDGLTLSVQAYVEDAVSPEALPFVQCFERERLANDLGRTAFATLCTVHLTKKQGHELCAAIFAALDMRQFDDEGAEYDTE